MVVYIQRGSTCSLSERDKLLMRSTREQSEAIMREDRQGDLRYSLKKWDFMGDGAWGKGGREGELAIKTCLIMCK